jgi:hypothetical protein
MKVSKKILYAIIVVLTVTLVCCVYLLNKEKQKNNLVPDATQLLSKLIDMVKDDIDETLGGYDFLHQWIKKDIDSFYVYSKYSPVYNSRQFKDYFKSYTDYDMEWFNILKSTQNTQSIEYDFFEKFVDFVFITRLQRDRLRDYCLFNGVGVDIFPEKDTIVKGEEYIATIGYVASFFETIPIMTVDGDTVPTTRNTQVFKERPSQKSGKVRHECTITFNQQGHFLELPFTIEYYVK